MTLNVRKCQSTDCKFKNIQHCQLIGLTFLKTGTTVSSVNLLSRLSYWGHSENRLDIINTITRSGNVAVDSCCRSLEDWSVP